MNQKTAIALLSVVIVGAVFYFLGFGPSFSEQSEAPAPMPEIASMGEAELTSAVVGLWRSVDDPKFTREFLANGTVVDAYEGYPEATISGTWFVFTDATAPDNLFFEPKGTYIQIIAGGEPYTFGLAGITENELQLVYMELGGVLSFTRQ